MRWTALFLCLLLPVAAHADNPFEWMLRTNGWGWSNGYHSNNNCLKVGHHAWAPMNDGGSAFTGESDIRGCGGHPGSMTPGYGAAQYQPTPAPPPPPEQLPGPMSRPKPGPMKAPMMGPMMNSPAMPDQEAYRRSWSGVRY